MIAPRAYSGPFARPPARTLVDAIGWSHVKVPNGPEQWRPDGWMVVYPDYICTFGLDGIARSVTLLYAP